MNLITLTTCLLGCLCVCYGEENKQKWSVHTKLGADVVMTCNDTYDGSILVQPGDTLSWRKKDGGPIVATADKYEFTAEYGIDKMMLTVKDITMQNAGIYLCDVTDSSGDYQTIFKGLNLGTYEHKDKMDEYEDHIVTGAICGACVLVLVVGVGLIDHFRHLTDEEKQEREELKRHYTERKARWADGGHQNLGADLDMAEDVKKSNEPAENGEQANTHL